MTYAITLRYFAARGRAQFLRYYLRARGVPFSDERVPLSADFSAWGAMRDDRSRAGPFHKLPVLVFDGRLVAETLPIAAFLHTTLGDEATLTADDRVQHEMLLSSLYTDVTVQVGTLLWAEVLFPGAGPTSRRQTHSRSVAATSGGHRANSRRVAMARTHPLAPRDAGGLSALGGTRYREARVRRPARTGLTDTRALLRGLWRARGL